MTDKRVIIRASQMPLLSRCAAPLHIAGVQIDAYNEAAELGTDVHRAISAMMETGSVPQDLPPDVAPLVHIARRWWRDHASAGEAITEQPLEARYGETLITGHPDVIIQGEADSTLVVDWKTTRLADVDYHQQMMAYLWLAGTGRRDITSFRYAVVYLRDCSHEISREFTFLDVEKWADDLLPPIIDWKGSGVYSPGPQCRYCPAFAVCEARAELLKSTALALTDKAALPSTGNELLELYRKAQVVETALGRFRDAVRLEVMAAGGQIDADDASLTLTESTREDINVAKAWATLRETVGDNALATCLSVRKSALMQAVGDAAPRGEKGARRNALLEELRAKGALIESTVRQLRIIPRKENPA